jgi:hypothetical protein
MPKQQPNDNGDNDDDDLTETPNHANTNDEQEDRKVPAPTPSKLLMTGCDLKLKVLASPDNPVTTLRDAIVSIYNKVK